MVSETAPGEQEGGDGGGRRRGVLRGKGGEGEKQRTPDGKGSVRDRGEGGEKEKGKNFCDAGRGKGHSVAAEPGPGKGLKDRRERGEEASFSRRVRRRKWEAERNRRASDSEGREGKEGGECRR